MADFQSIIYQMILAVLRDAEITSANPTHTNTFKGLTVGSEEIGLDEELQAAVVEAIQNTADEEDSKKSSSKALESKAVSISKKGISATKDPTSIVTMGLALLPHAVLISFAISLAPLIFTELTRPGGALDLRFKRIIEDEFNGFLSRQTQKDTEMGVRQVIVQSKTGFTALNGDSSFNTMRGIREGGINKERLDRLDMTDHSKGLFDDR